MAVRKIRRASTGRRTGGGTAGNPDDQPYRLMVEQMHDGALTLSSTGSILYCNKRFAELMALPPQRIAGTHFSEFVAPGQIARLHAMLHSAAFREEVQLVTALGVVTPALLSSTTIRVGKARTIAVVVTDMTSERVARALRDANRLKEEFLATLSHELRTPLNVILGYTRMLLGDYIGEESRRRALEVIDRNARAQTRLVDDLVDMSRITAGKVSLLLQPQPLIPLLEAALEAARPAAEAKGIHVESSWDPNGTSVIADSMRLQQMMWNLLANATKFTPEGGAILVATVRGLDQVRISVTDSGIGIDEAFLPHVFDRFRQGDGGPTRAYSGLGLGLSIVHELTQLHGGTVEAHSAGPGRGATFTLTLPAIKGSLTRRRHPRSTAPPQLTGYRVLVVEDHKDSRDLFVQTLETFGAVVLACGAVGEAVDALDRFRPSVIVADIGLPHEDGYGFIRRVRTHAAVTVRSIPAIAVTSYATDEDRAMALNAGFQRHLSKPLDPTRLAETIYHVAGGTSAA